jgi:hypothetical protein
MWTILFPWDLFWIRVLELLTFLLAPLLGL